ncbi:MAG TPA: Uma2 family endonuclease, partial [Vicinamibacterales bacterium]|nr:Uma2 family endonuclease [Vicinamibacterales bacterium]
TQPKLLTAEEFFLRPHPQDGSQEELVRGEIITMPPPGGLHGVTCSKVDRKIGAFVEAGPGGTVACNDTGFITHRAPDSVRGPDISYWSKARLGEVPVGYIDVAPDMLVEVLSPSNTSKQIREKLTEYFAKGVRLVWVISPEDRTLTIYRTPDEGRVLHESATLADDDVLRGFTCRVSELLP